MSNGDPNPGSLLHSTGKHVKTDNGSVLGSHSPVRMILNG